MTLKHIKINWEGKVEKISNLPPDIPKKKSEVIYITEDDLITVERKPRLKDTRENGHWHFPEKMDPNNYFGFIYLIKNKQTGMLYIGKKQYKGAGKQNKGQETNWKTYYSSCKELKTTVDALGRDSLEFYVLEQYKLRGSLGYAETWSIMHVEALANRHIWINGLVNKVSWNVKERITERHKQRLAMLTGKYDGSLL